MSAPVGPAVPASPSRLRGLTAAGAAGAAAMAAASWWVAATPVRFDRERPGPLAWFAPRGVPAFLVNYLGLAVLGLAWLALGRRVLARDAAASAAVLRRFVAASAAPFLLAAPFGRDLWAYAAQGNLVAHGVDPYRHGPATVPGAFTAEVSGRWIHSPSPYGPLWLRAGQLADWVSGGHPTVAALLLRLPAYAGLLLCGWALAGLARRVGLDARLAAAIWLGLANPLTITLGVGGGHNDLIMLGLALAGLALAARPGLGALAAGAALAGAAVLVKSPAVVAVAFTVPVWLRANGLRPEPRRVVAGCATALAASAATVAAITAACGLGVGWARQVDSDSSWVSWLSVPSGVGMLGHVLTGAPLKAVDETMRVARTVGEVLAVLVVAGLWLAALRYRPIALLTVAFGASALLAPSVQPWYYCWALALAGLVVTRRAGLIVLAAVGLVFAVTITPDGFGLESGPWAPAVIALGLLAGWLALRRPGSAPDHDRADDARAEVGADDGAELGHV